MAQTKHKELLDVLSRCAAECEHCIYNVCLGDPQMKTCGQLCIDCAQICHTTMTYVSRMSQFMHQSLQMCADICDACAQECERFPDNEDMRRCAEVCRECARSCRDTAQQRAAA